MKKLIGELGHFTAPISICFNASEKQTSYNLFRSLERVFGNYLNLEVFDLNNEVHFKEKKYRKSKSKVLILTSLSKIDYGDLEQISKSKVLIGFLEFREEGITTETIRKISLLDRVITCSQHSYELLSATSSKDKIYRIDLALDLRRFYNLKSNLLEKSGCQIGVVCDKEQAKIFISNIDLLSKHLSAHLDLTLLLQPVELSLDEYNELKHAIPIGIKNRIILLDPVYSIWQQMEFFKSIDCLLDLLPKGSFNPVNLEATSADIRVIYLDELHSICGILKRGSQKAISNTLVENDFRLLKFKYKKVFFSDFQEVDESKRLVVVPSDAGFFSVFNTLISIKAFWKGVHGFSQVTPEWSSKKVLDFWQTENLTSYCYAGIEEGNVFYSIFDNYEAFEDLKSSLNKDANRGKTYEAHSPNLEADPDLTYVFADRLYRSAGFEEWRKEMHRELEGLRPNPLIVKRIDSVFEKVTKDDLVVGMHVRHPSHAMEQPNSEIPLSEDFIRVAQEIILAEKMKYRNIYVFLATDQQIVVEEFKSVFGDKLIAFSEITRVTETQSKEYDSLEESKKLSVGHQVQHIAASDRAKWSSNLAFEIVCDAWALARSQIFLHSVSNVATAVTYINPDLISLPIRKRDSLEKAKGRKSLAQISSMI
jgi:hypothetical protein